MLGKEHLTQYWFVSLILMSPLLHAMDHQHHHMNHQHSAAPLGVMGTHLHQTGGWMFSYQVMNMRMDGMAKGTSHVSADEVATTFNTLGGEPMHMGDFADGTPRIMNVPDHYRIAPINMQMNMQMFGIMYGVSDNITAMLMLNYLKKDMKMRTYRGRMGTHIIGDFNGHTSGMGDTQLTALINLKDLTQLNMHLNIGLSLPTGSIKEKGSVLPPFAGMMGTTASEKVEIDRLAYTMQLGSGSYDLLLGTTYTAQQASLYWGGQVKATLPLQKNSQDYRLGNQFEATAWLGKQWMPALSTSIRLLGQSIGQIRGRDDLITGGNPLSNTDNSGRDTISLYLGVNLAGQDGIFKNQRLDLEMGAPLYEQVDGLQMRQDWTLNLGWSMIF